MLARGIKRLSSFQKAVVPELNYGYDELQPLISTEIMETHHGKHHTTYVNNYNSAMEQFSEAQQKGDHEKLSNLGQTIKFNGGGHVNHSIYWENLANPNKEGGDLPEASSQFAKDITEAWGGFDQFISAFNAQTAAIQGSGWGWLAHNSKTGRLSIESTPNQDIISGQGFDPLLGNFFLKSD